MSEYPRHKRLEERRAEAGLLSEFLVWLEERGLNVPERERHVLEFLGVDWAAYRAEKRARTHPARPLPDVAAWPTPEDGS